MFSVVAGFSSHLRGQCEFPRILSGCDTDIPQRFNILTLKSSDIMSKGGIKGNRAVRC